MTQTTKSPSNAADRQAALAQRGEATPCQVCRRPTLAASGVCDRHPAPALFTRAGAPYAGQTTTNDAGQVGYTAPKICTRCGGGGGSDKWRHTGWTCFDCQGKRTLGDEFHRLYTAEALVKLNAAQAKRAATAEAKRAAAQAVKDAEAAARRQAFDTQHGALLARCEALTDRVVLDIVARARATAALTAPQAALLVRAAERAEQRAAEAAVSQHVGTVGERLVVEVSVQRVASFERPSYHQTGYRGAYSVDTVHVVTMVDAAGNQIVSKSPSFVEPVGERFTLRATVKEHATYQGAAQTVVQRALRTSTH